MGQLCATTFGPDQRTNARGVAWSRGWIRAREMRFRAKRGTHLCSRLGARAFFYKRPVSHFCARFFPFQPTTAGVVFLSEILRRRRPLPRRRCVSRSYEMKKDSRFCSVLFCRPNRQPIRSVQNHQRHGRDHDSSRQESPETEPPS